MHDLSAIKTFCEQDFYFFVRYFWPIVEPNPLVEDYYLQEVCLTLQACKPGQGVIVNLAPGLAKSLIGLLFTVWVWTKEPHHKWICASHKIDLATRDNVRARRVLESRQFKQLWDIKLTTDQNTKQSFENNYGGYRIVLSVNSGNVGYRCDSLLIDDPNELLQSSNEREEVFNWHSQVMTPRLNDPRKGRRIIIQQRIAPNDLSGRLLQTEPELWTHLKLPIQDKNGKPLSKRYPKEELARIKRRLGSLAFNAQYLQEPLSQEGKVFKTLPTYTEEKDHFQCGDQRIPKDQLQYFGSSDLAISQKQTADWTVFQVWAWFKNTLLLVHQYRDRLTGVEILERFEAWYKAHKLSFLGVEDVAFQRLVIEQLRAKGLNIVAYRPVNDKVARTTTAQIRIENQEMFFPDDPEVLKELAEFPGSQHDDVTDTVSQAAILAAKYCTFVEPKPEPTEDDLRRRQVEHYNWLLMQGM